MDETPSNGDLFAQRRKSGKDGWRGKESSYDLLWPDIYHFLNNPYVPATGKLLEMGCGAGNLTLRFVRLGYAAYGVDISPEAIEWAREKSLAAGAPATFAVGDVTDLAGFEDGFFDLVIDGYCLHWLYGDKRPRFLSEARRVLRSGGFFLVCSQCESPASPEDMRKRKVTYDPLSHLATHESGRVVGYFGTAESIVDEVKASGFDVITSQVMTDQDGDKCLYVGAIKPKIMRSNL